LTSTLQNRIFIVTRERADIRQDEAGTAMATTTERRRAVRAARRREARGEDVLALDFSTAIAPEGFSPDTGEVQGAPRRGLFPALHCWNGRGLALVAVAPQFGSSAFTKAAQRWLADWEVAWRKGRELEERAVPSTLATSFLRFSVGIPDGALFLSGRAFPLTPGGRTWPDLYPPSVLASELEGAIK